MVQQDSSFSPRFLHQGPASLGPAGCGTSAGRDPSIKVPPSARHSPHPTQRGQTASTGPQKTASRSPGHDGWASPCTVSPCLWDAQTAGQSPGTITHPGYQATRTGPQVGLLLSLRQHLEFQPVRLRGPIPLPVRDRWDTEPQGHTALRVPGCKPSQGSARSAIPVTPGLSAYPRGLGAQALRTWTEG